MFCIPKCGLSQKMFYVHLRRLYTLLLQVKCSENVNYIHLVYFVTKATVPLLIFCLEDLSTDVNGLLKSPTVVVLLPMEIKKKNKTKPGVAPMFIAAQFTTAKCWNQPKCPSVNEWIKKLQYIYTIEYYTAERKKGLPPFAISMDETGERYAE